MRIKCFKKLSIRFSIDRKLGSINRKCFDWSSINRASIETDRGWPKIFNRNFDWSKNRFDRSKFWKKTNFWKIKASLCRNSLKNLNWWIKCMSMRWHVFQKTQVLNQIFLILRFSIHSLKFSSIEYDLHKTQRIFKLGWSNQKHTQ